MTPTLMEIVTAGVTGIPVAACAPLGLGVALLLVLHAARKAVRPAARAVTPPALVADEVRRAA